MTDDSFIFSGDIVLSAHQISLETIEVLRHLHTLLLALHKGGKTLGDFHLSTDGSLYCILEFGWMGSLAEHTVFTILKLFAESTIATSAMRVENV